MPSTVTDQIAERVRRLRSARGLTLEALANASGVSRSAISLIERAETSPTAVVLERLATGLGVPLAALFERSEATASPHARRADQVEWTDSVSGYTRRNVSPNGGGVPFRIVEVSFPAGAHVAFESGGLGGGVHQQIWVLEGAVTVTVGMDRYALEAGDCLAMRLDQPIAFENPARVRARYAVVLADVAELRRSRGGE